MDARLRVAGARAQQNAHPQAVDAPVVGNEEWFELWVLVVAHVIVIIVIVVVIFICTGAPNKDDEQGAGAGWSCERISQLDTQTTPTTHSSRPHRREGGGPLLPLLPPLSSLPVRTRVLGLYGPLALVRPSSLTLMIWI